MNQRERYLEENTARLIRAAFDPNARPSPHASERAFQSLLADVRARSAAVAFPDSAVGVLGATLALAATWLAIQAAAAATSFIANPPLLLMAAWLALNLALVPIASVVILIRRQHA